MLQIFALKTKDQLSILFSILKIRQKVIDTKIDLINSKIENTFYGCKIIGIQGDLPVIIPKLKVKS